MRLIGIGRRRFRPAHAGRIAFLALALGLLGLSVGCSSSGSETASADGTVTVVTTTNIITDLAEVIGGDRVEVKGLMGPGVDPHLYRASAGDVSLLRDADLILYGGLELEGKMGDLLEELGRARPVTAVTGDIPESELLEPTGAGGRFDPHVWFSAPLWKFAARTAADALGEVDPESAPDFLARSEAYQAELDELDSYIRGRVTEIPNRSRVLITSHDAFQYFGDAYGMQVEAIQGISTATEATTADIDRISDVIAERKLAAVYVESSVPRQTIEAVIAAAKSKGQNSMIGGELFSDSAGEKDTPEGTYIGAARHNIDTITEGLK